MSTAQSESTAVRDSASHPTPARTLRGWFTRLFTRRSSESLCSELNAAEAMRNHAAWRNRLLATGQPARAVVRELSHSNPNTGDPAFVTLQLDIHADGYPAWHATVAAPLSKLDIPHLNDVIEVRYDPKNRESVALV